MKWQTRTNSPHSSSHKGKKQPLHVGVFPPRVAATLMVSCSWQQVQGLFSSGFHDASRGRAPRQCCPRSELLSHFGSSQTRISVLPLTGQIHWRQLSAARTGRKEISRSDNIYHPCRWRIHFKQEVPQSPARNATDGHLKIRPRRKALMSLEELGDLKQESA